MYLMKTVTCGDFVEVKRYHAPSAKPKGTPRAKRKKLSSEAMKKLNRNKAIEKLTWLLRCNFLGGVHFHLVLTYEEGKNRSCTFEQMKADIKKFIKVFRKAYLERFGKEFCYVFSYGVGKGGFRHFHMVCNIIAGDEQDLFEKVWRKSVKDSGSVFSTKLYERGRKGEDFKDLAEYIIKNGEEALNYFEEAGKNYHPSKNLKKPIIEIEKITRASSFRKKVFVPSGYVHLPECDDNDTDAYGFEYFKYVIRRTE